MGAVIQTEGLGKHFRIQRASDANYHTLRDALASTVSGMWRGRFSAPKDEFWALRDIDIEIKAGERVGIVGSNGAGKSTFLKVLSRITEPSVGMLRIRGRVASLLEVGTGFHPELSGRENIFLNGAILGMSRVDIARQFDEIVDFANVEKFLDTPVKRYSSGMYMRLAFAVAAHLDSDILIVDEVLAVGDEAFQRRCLSRMRDVGSSGRTVLFVSHNLGMIQSLCGRAILLDAGRVISDGVAAEVLAQYTGNTKTVAGVVNVQDAARHSRGLGERVRIVEVGLLNAAGKLSSELVVGEPFTVMIRMIAYTPQDGISVVVGITSDDSSRLMTAFSQHAAFALDASEGQERVVEAKFDSAMLFPGDYGFDVALRSGQQGLDFVRFCLRFSVNSLVHERISPAPGLYGRLGTFVDWKVSSSWSKEMS